MDLSELIARLEKCSGRDRRLDIDIYRYFNPPDLSRVDHSVVLPKGFGDDDWSREMDPAPHYTASLDAALTLVPEGWWIHEMGQRLNCENVHGVWCWQVQLMHTDPAATAYVGFNSGIWPPSAPIALCIAALKARQSLQSSKTRGVEGK